MEEDNKPKPIQPIPKPVEVHGAIVETFVEDMAKAIGSGTGESIRNIIHEEDELEQEKKALDPNSKLNKIFVLSGSFFIVLALGLLAFLIYKSNNNTVFVEKQFTPLVFSDQSASVDISGLKKDAIVEAVLSEINKTTVKNEGVEGVYLTENKQAIGLRSFITLIGSSFTPDTNPVFVQDNFLLGTVKNDGFFMLLKVRSITDIFDSLRAWEPTLLADLHGFLGMNINSDTSYLFKKAFQDGIVENKNARILYDKDGKIVLMYIFASDSSVVITDSEAAAQ
jgi:hypothetical protein